MEVVAIVYILVYWVCYCGDCNLRIDCDFVGIDLLRGWGSSWARTDRLARFLLTSNLMFPALAQPFEELPCGSVFIRFRDKRTQQQTA